MAEQVFVKVLGFDDAERHALNTLFRLSETGPVHYLLWAPDAPSTPQLALVDGDSYEAQLALGLQQHAAPQLIWVGDNPPASALRTFSRPLHWPHVVQAMDSLFGILPEMDLDLGFDVVATEEAWPDTAPPPDADGAASAEPAKRVLVINPSLEERLYLRARLALDGLLDVDEAVTGAEGLACIGKAHYHLVIADAQLADVWWVLRELRGAQPQVPHLVFCAPTMLWRLRARLRGATAWAKPYDPAQLHDLLQRV
ncbi:MAG: response regulator [Ramlibacter sp.]